MSPRSLALMSCLLSAAMACDRSGPRAQGSVTTDTAPLSSPAIPDTAPPPSSVSADTVRSTPPVRRPEPAVASDPPASHDERMGTLELPDGRRFRTAVYDLAVIGTLRTETKLPYYLLSGRGCIDCDANIAIYIHSPSDGPMKIEGEQPRFPYPGREVTFDEGAPIYEASMFYGDCLPAYPNAVVWFQRRWAHDMQPHESVLIVRVRNDSLVQTELRADLPTISSARRAVDRGKCRELEGVERSSEP